MHDAGRLESVGISATYAEADTPERRISRLYSLKIRHAAAQSKLTRRGALAGAAANLLIVKPHTAFGTQANSAVAFGIIGTGGRGCARSTLKLP